MPDTYAVGEKDMASNALTQVKSIAFWLKVVQLIVNIIVIALLSEGSFIANIPKCFVAFGTPFAFVIVNAILIAGLLLEEALSKRMSMVLTTSAGLLFVTAGALMIESWVNFKLQNDLTLGAGIVSIILSLVYFGDTGYTFKFV
ncbi:Hypothetical predicted protein [Cloeon dipterum]|uniref:DUF7775 domain-containing protein n=1 Tax=Cloeon dipterum TaxID=197152 RepID=A0A8S1DQX7_9INSE|nr:Hypothetical predicted protein [Cloeon dipterum]